MKIVRKIMRRADGVFAWTVVIDHRLQASGLAASRTDANLIADTAIDAARTRLGVPE